MKALPFKIPKTEHSSFHIQVDDEPYFYDTLHQHPEIQLTVILESTGNLIYGDHLGAFQPGDVFLIGSNVPHVFRSDARYYKEESGLRSKSLSIFFDQHTFGSQFLNLPESKSLTQLLVQAEQGMRLNVETAEKVGEWISSIFEAEGLNRMILLLQILNELSTYRDYALLTNRVQMKRLNEVEGKRLNDIFRFTMQEYQRPIALEEVAAVANMSLTAFCRYFKQHTRKTYLQFLNEYRVSQACKSLSHRDKSVAQICFESGFNNLSNFNRKFKEVIGKTPREYVKGMVK